MGWTWISERARWSEADFSWLGSRCRGGLSGLVFLAALGCGSDTVGKGSEAGETEARGSEKAPGGTGGTEVSYCENQADCTDEEVCADGVCEPGLACNINEDCPDGDVCITTCNDWCDQTTWPNPCCWNICMMRNTPWACEANGGIAIALGEDCPAGTGHPAAPGDWVPYPDGLCCIADWPCDKLGSRSRCEAYTGCTWLLSANPGPANQGVCVEEDA